jgi:predicted aldo/keto reductase-like oxidoreductase
MRKHVFLFLTIRFCLLSQLIILRKIKSPTFQGLTTLSFFIKFMVSFKQKLTHLLIGTNKNEHMKKIFSLAFLFFITNTEAQLLKKIKDKTQQVLEPKRCQLPI